MLPALNPGMPRPKKYRRTFIRQWRKHRKLTLEQLAEAVDMTPSHLSMLENGQRGYTQETLESVAAALRTDVGSLLTRAPGDSDEMLTVLQEAKPAQRRQIIEIAKTLLKTGT